MTEITIHAADQDSSRPPSLADALRRRANPPPLSEYRLKEIQLQLGDLSDDDSATRKQLDAGFLLCTAWPSGMVSLVLHLSLLIALGLYMLTPRHFGAEAISIEVVAIEEEEEEEELAEVEIMEDVVLDLEPQPEMQVPEPDLDEMLGEDDELDSADQLVPTDIAAMLRAIGEDTTVGPTELTSGSIAGMGVGEISADGGLATRDFRRRQALSYGATQESENAVELALEWLARHQRQDGSWSFNHRSDPLECPNCRCGNPGADGGCHGATALALLPFLGAGRTHLHGEYQPQVTKGLRYLMRQQKQDGSLMDPHGRLYSHGLATLALCEAYAMARYQFPPPVPDPDTDPGAEDRFAGQASDISRDPASDADWSVFADQTDADLLQSVGLAETSGIGLNELASAAQRAIGFIERAQHQRGGWRYTPGQAGDTSVVGWQLMALKSGHLAGLTVQPATIKKAVKFLDAVQQRRGVGYGYTNPGNGAATSAIGLLCRMFTGWNRERRSLVRGVTRLEQMARPHMGLYFYYYATQVMHHYGGAPWHKWNLWMRDHLVVAQDRGGPEAGSWLLQGSHDATGRLYCTSMATMTLEVYYRYSPIYGHGAVRSAPVATAATSQAGAGGTSVKLSP